MTRPTPTDPQSVAFREAEPEDSWDGAIASLVVDGAVHHPPIVDVGEIRLPEDYESDNWDGDREGPKTLDEARAALAARIDARSAPDARDVAGAYDDEHTDEVPDIHPYSGGDL